MCVLFNFLKERKKERNKGPKPCFHEKTLPKMHCLSEVDGKDEAALGDRRK